MTVAAAKYTTTTNGGTGVMNVTVAVFVSTMQGGTDAKYAEYDGGGGAAALPGGDTVYYLLRIARGAKGNL